MTNVVNLRMARKQKARKTREVKADQNRALHSISKKERDLKNAQVKLEKDRLDGHSLEGGQPDE